MVKAIKILAKIIGACFLIVLVLWIISYAIGISIYVKNAVNVPKLSSLEQQKEYVAQREKEISKDIDIFKLLFAGGGWRYRAVLTLNQKIFEYFPEEANNDVDALFRLADCYVWLGGVKYREKAIALYQKSIDVFKAKHMAEKAPAGSDPIQFEIRKYKFLIDRHKQIAGNYQKLRRYDKVLDEYKKIILLYSDKIKDSNISEQEQYPLIGQIYENIGLVCLYQYKNYSDAIKWFNKTQEIFPTLLSISTNRTNVGDCYLAMGNEEKAKEIYQSVINDFKNYKGKWSVNFTDAQNRLKKLKMWKKILTHYEPLLY